MRKVTLWIMLIGLAMPGRLSAQERAGKKSLDPAWTVLGVGISKPLPESDFMPLGRGTILEAQLQIENATIVGLEGAACKLTSFSDDKGTNLLGKLGGPRAVQSTSMRDNRKGVSVTLHADGIPAVGATKLRLKGTIVVLLGKDEKERAP